MRTFVIVDRPEAWPAGFDEVDVVPARDYLTQEAYFRTERARVFNLCRSYRYQGTGYYVSLLAEARGHRPMPDINAIRDLAHRGVLRLVSDELDAAIQHSLGSMKSDRFTLSIYFGRNLAKRHDDLAHRLFAHFRVPLIRAQFARVQDRWELKNIYPIPVGQVPDEHQEFLLEAARKYFASPRKARARKQPRYHLALLVDPKEAMPPSNPQALENFCRAAERLDIAPDRITRDDLYRLSTYDALFIRETTYVNNHTFRFARQAEKDGLVVIDDPTSILRCTNKVYQCEMLRANRLPAPRTLVLHRQNLEAVAEEIGFPCILKAPDSSFSQGVVKAKTRDDLMEQARDMLTRSELLVVQEFMPTDFDWRVGILNGVPLYVCKYFMHRGHWQIYETGAAGKVMAGDATTLRVEDAPPAVVRVALRAANLIGRGLYGVDVKEVHGKPYVIEVNDNPSIDAGCEDELLGQFLYDRVMEVFNQRLVERTQSLRSS